MGTSGVRKVTQAAELVGGVVVSYDQHQRRMVGDTGVRYRCRPGPPGSSPGQAPHRFTGDTRQLHPDVARLDPWIGQLSVPAEGGERRRARPAVRHHCLCREFTCSPSALATSPQPLHRKLTTTHTTNKQNEHNQQLHLQNEPQQQRTHHRKGLHLLHPRGDFEQLRTDEIR